MNLGPLDPLSHPTGMKYLESVTGLMANLPLHVGKNILILVVH